MIKHVLVAVLSASLIGAPIGAAVAQAATEKIETTKKPRRAKAEKSEKSSKPLSAQQQKMKTCASKWGDYKKEKSVKGRTEYRKFMSGCLKG